MATTLAVLDPPEPLLGKDRAALTEIVTARGAPAYRAAQLARRLYRLGAHTLPEMAELPAPLREALARSYEVGRGQVTAAQTATDGVVKLLLRYRDGCSVETVVLPYAGRTAACISTQVGCPVGCVFCATATMGFTRNLTTGELVDQVLTAGEVARDRGHSPLSHVVAMGMGEPLLNLDALLPALVLLRDEVGISLRRVTVSTAGHVPGMRRLAMAALPVTLALSLHAPTDDLRARLIPMARRWPLAEVIPAARDYFRHTGRRVTLEYLVLGGVNDGPDHAEALAALVRGDAGIGHVNLIPWNPAETLAPFSAPSRNALRRFRAALEQHGLQVTQRLERGQEIAAACGQLAVRGEAVAHPRAVPLPTPEPPA